MRQLLLIVSLAGALGMAGCGNDTPAVLCPEVIELGTIYSRAAFSVSVPMHNASLEPIEVSRVIVSCGCIQVLRHPSVIAAGASDEILLEVNPGLQGHGLQQSRVVPILRVAGEETAGPAITMRLSLEPVLQCQPSVLALAPHVIGSEASELTAEALISARAGLNIRDLTLESTAPSIAVITAQDGASNELRVCIRVGLGDAMHLTATHSLRTRSSLPELDGMEIPIRGLPFSPVSLRPPVIVLRDLVAGQAFSREVSVTLLVPGMTLEQVVPSSPCVHATAARRSAGEAVLLLSGETPADATSGITSAELTLVFGGSVPTSHGIPIRFLN